MQIIRAVNVADAWVQGILLVSALGQPRDSRAGPVRVIPEPVATVYEKPWERVLLDPVRDANPIFHLHEALWMLAGRNDATWLDRFVGNFSERFAEDGGIQHGAYGWRWRSWFAANERQGWLGASDGTIDQLDEAVRLLSENPEDRQVVIQMWDPSADLGVRGLKDRPCNQQVMLRADRMPIHGEWRYLDMTVTCRSNDMVWGAYGANAVHFSIMQEYLASRLGFAVGRYTQVSNNFHVYEATRGRADLASAEANAAREYPESMRIVGNPATFDEDVARYVRAVETAENVDSFAEFEAFDNPFLGTVALPMAQANELRKRGDWDGAFEAASRIAADDWRIATVEWLGRRRDGSKVAK